PIIVFNTLGECSKIGYIIVVKKTSISVCSKTLTFPFVLMPFLAFLQNSNRHTLLITRINRMGVRANSKILSLTPAVSNAPNRTVVSRKITGGSLEFNIKLIDIVPQDIFVFFMNHVHIFPSFSSLLWCYLKMFWWNLP